MQDRSAKLFRSNWSQERYNYSEQIFYTSGCFYLTGSDLSQSFKSSKTPQRLVVFLVVASKTLSGLVAKWFSGTSVFFYYFQTRDLCPLLRWFISYAVVHRLNNKLDEYYIIRRVQNHQKPLLRSELQIHQWKPLILVTQWFSGQPLKLVVLVAMHNLSSKNGRFSSKKCCFHI